MQWCIFEKQSRGTYHLSQIQVRVGNKGTKPDKLQQIFCTNCDVVQELKNALKNMLLPLQCQIWRKWKLAVCESVWMTTFSWWNYLRVVCSRACLSGANENDWIYVQTSTIKLHGKKQFFNQMACIRIQFIEENFAHLWKQMTRQHCINLFTRESFPTYVRI